MINDHFDSIAARLSACLQDVITDCRFHKLTMDLIESGRNKPLAFQ